MRDLQKLYPSVDGVEQLYYTTATFEADPVCVEACRVSPPPTTAALLHKPASQASCARRQPRCQHGSDRAYQLCLDLNRRWL